VTEAEVDALVRGAGLRLIIDLRGAAEGEIHGRGLLSRHVHAYLNLPIMIGSEGSSGPLPKMDSPDLASHYIGYLEASAPRFAMAVRVLADSAHLPALFHAPPARIATGTMAAVLLDAIGVRHEDIIEDYAMTAAAMHPGDRAIPAVQAIPRSEQGRLPHAFDFRAGTMRRLLAYLQEHHGGAAQWLRSAGSRRPRSRH